MQEENVDNFIHLLNLQPHPEGGYYKETYRAAESISAAGLPTRFDSARNISTAIYFLLPKSHFSAFHRIRSDECWHWYAGGTLLIHMINKAGNYSCIKLGKQLGQNENFQFVVPATIWFASEPAPDTNFVLTGCTVAPGFDFADFEMAEKEILLQQFPQYSEMISRLCRE